MSHRQDFCPCVAVGGSVHHGQLGKARHSITLQLTAEADSGSGRLIGGLDGVSGSSLGGGTGGSQSAMEGSGVVSRKLLMYFVSAISKFSSTSSRSSMRSARWPVSLSRRSVLAQYYRPYGRHTRWKTVTGRQSRNRLAPRYSVPAHAGAAWSAHCGH